MKVGIFDSGIGGLSVLHHAMKVMPDTHFIYYADETHVPYGEKTTDQIRGFVEEIINFLIGRGADAIVIACNTATSVASREFREQFSVPIVGMEPAVKKAVERYPGQRILVAATPVTIAGNKLQHLLERVDREHEADLVALPGLVRFAEAGDFASAEAETYLRRELQGFDLSRYGALVLGCTHFNYFKRLFQKVFPGPVHFVDGNEGTIRQLLRVVSGRRDADEGQRVEYYFSGRPVDEEERARLKRYLEQLEAVYEPERV